MIPGTHEVLVESWHPLQGVTRWRNHNDFCVLQIHHSADPEKDDAWAEKASKRYPGGRKGKGWRREMDIDWSAGEGGLVYAEFGLATHVIPAMKVPEEWPRFRVLDPGYANPFGVLWAAVDGDGTLHLYDELYHRKKTVPQMASLIKGRTGRQKIEYTLIDPSAVNKTLQGGGQSICDQLADEGIFTNPGDNAVVDGIAAVRSMLALMDNGEPRIKVHDTCENLIWEFFNYRYPTQTPQQREKQGEPEKPLKKNDHLMDCLRYLVMAVPQNYVQDTGGYDPHTSEVAIRTLSQRARRKAILSTHEKWDEDWDE